MDLTAVALQSCDGDLFEQAIVSEERRIPGREFMEETYRDTSVSDSLDSPGGRFGLRLGIAINVDAG
jgi:hypothetical protein